MFFSAEILKPLKLTEQDLKSLERQNRGKIEPEGREKVEKVSGI